MRCLQWERRGTPKAALVDILSKERLLENTQIGECESIGDVTCTSALRVGQRLVAGPRKTKVK